MVSLEEQNTYLSNAVKTEKLRAFYSMLQLSKFNYSDRDLSEIDEIYFQIINSIVNNSKGNFEKYYTKISKRIPVENTPFIHNDYLIFSIILGVFLFNKDKSWIKMVVGKRSNSQITSTFESILNDNYSNNTNIQEIVTVFLFLTKKQKISNEILEETYKSILNSSDLFKKKNDFQILISLKAFESILSLIKEFPNREEFNFLKNFESKFKKRIINLSNFIYYFVLIVFIFFIYKIVKDNQGLKKVLDDLGSILGIFGLAVGGGTFAIFKKKFQLLMLKLFGHNRNKVI